jgi:hypothetical protein
VSAQVEEDVAVRELRRQPVGGLSVDKRLDGAEQAKLCPHGDPRSRNSLAAIVHHPRSAS